MTLYHVSKGTPCQVAKDDGGAPAFKSHVTTRDNVFSEDQRVGGSVNVPAKVRQSVDRDWHLFLRDGWLFRVRKAAVRRA